MSILILTGSILVYSFLGLYLFLVWKTPKQTSQYIKAIRATWYFVFITGSLIYINLYPQSIFNDWEKYLIILIAFFLIDSFIFLNLYFSKFGGSELKEHPETEEAIALTQESLNQVKIKVDNLTKVLHDYEFISYTEDKLSFIQKFEELIQEYSSLENLVIDIIPYNTDEERREVEKSVFQKFKIKRWLSKDLTYFHPKENFFLQPLYFFDEKYVAKGTVLNKGVNVTETDVQAINLLFITYSLMVEISSKEENRHE